MISFISAEAAGLPRLWPLLASNRLRPAFAVRYSRSEVPKFRSRNASAAPGLSGRFLLIFPRLVLTNKLLLATCRTLLLRRTLTTSRRLGPSVTAMAMAATRPTLSAFRSDRFSLPHAHLFMALQLAEWRQGRCEFRTFARQASRDAWALTLTVHVLPAPSTSITHALAGTQLRGGAYSASQQLCDLR